MRIFGAVFWQENSGNRYDFLEVFLDWGLIFSINYGKAPIWDEQQFYSCFVV